MKKILFIAGLVLLTSCITTQRFKLNTVVLDYMPYTTQGFFLSESNSVNFDYLPVSSIVTTATSGSLPSGQNKKAEPEDALREFVEQCIAKRANGAINLKATTITDKDGFVKGYAITGMAIKIIPAEEK